MRSFFKRFRTVFVVLAIVGAATAVWAFTQRGENQAASTFQTATVKRGTLTATIGATGTVRAKQTAVLIWQAAGTVDVVNVRVGDNIPTDFVMAYLRKTSLPQSVILAEAELANAQTSLDELLHSNTALAESVIVLRDAQEAYDKAVNWRKELNGRIKIKKIVYKEMFGRTIPEIKEYKGYADETTIAKADEDLALAQAKLDDAQRTFDRLSAGNGVEIAAARARVDAAQATLNLARVSAPFSGIVTESYPLPGDQVGAGATAFRIDDLSDLYVDVEVSEVDINSVAVGQSVALTFDAILGRDYHGEVVAVAPTGTETQGVVNFKVTVELTDADAMVKPGMTAAVNITVEELNDVLLVPNRAVRLSDGRRVVYLLVNGQPVQTDIRLGSSSDTMSALSSGDVKEGDIVILNPPAEFGPGGGPGGGFGG